MEYHSEDPREEYISKINVLQDSRERSGMYLLCSIKSKKNEPPSGRTSQE